MEVWLQADAARLNASALFWSQVRPFFVPAVVRTLIYCEAEAGGGLSNRMYAVVSSVILAVAAGAAVRVRGNALRDLEHGGLFDPPPEVLSMLRGGSPINRTTPAIMLDYRIRSWDSWRRLSTWRSIDGVGGLAPKASSTLRVISNEWFAPLLLNQSAGGRPGHGQVRDWVGTTNPFDAIAALLYRPAGPILAAADRLSRSVLPPGRTLSIHIRTQILFQFINRDNASEAPQLKAAMLSLIAQCAGREAAAHGLDHVFISGDSPPAVAAVAGVLGGQLKIITSGDLISAAPEVAQFDRSKRALLDSLLLGRAAVCLSSPVSTFSDVASSRSRCEKRISTSCLPVGWRTLGHFARKLVAADGNARPAGCAIAFGSNEEAATLPCGAPCELHREWGGALPCGLTPARARRQSLGRWLVESAAAEGAWREAAGGTWRDASWLNTSRLYL